MFLDLGTYSVTVTEDGRGVSFTAQPTPLAIISVLFSFMFPPYILFFFLCFHAMLGNRWFMKKVDPAFDTAYTHIKQGTEVFVDNVRNLVHDMTQEVNDEADDPSYYDEPVQLESMSDEEEEDDLDGACEADDEREEPCSDDILQDVDFANKSLLSEQIHDPVDVDFKVFNGSTTDTLPTFLQRDHLSSSPEPFGKEDFSGPQEPSPSS